MPKTVLIILAAVVALIVIVVLTGMRYLRADDDDFDDDAPAEHGRARSRGNHPTREQQARPRARHGEDMPDERRTERVGAARAARSGAVYGGERGPDGHGAARVGQDRGWRDDSGEIPPSGEIPRSGEMPRGGRELAPQREQRPVRAARGGHADVNEPVAASRSGRSQPGRGASRRLEEFDSQPGRAAAPTSVYEREAAGGRERHDDKDRIARHEEADFAGRRESRDRRDDREIRDPRDSRDSRDRTHARPAASVREIGDHDELDRRVTGPNARTDARKNGARSERGESLPAVKARQGKSKRDSDGDWPTNEWDELSDVDYWAELASDKPLTTAVPSGQGSRARRRESRQDARPGPDRAEREDGSAGSELAVRQASRRERQPGQELLPPVARKPDVAASDRLAAFDQLSASDRRAATGRPTAVMPAAARPAPADDDPLTSPSFPRIAADDSRSYRRTRPAAPEARQPASRETDALQPMLNGGHAPPSVLSEPHTAYPAEPHTAYPAVPRVGSVSGLEGASQTRSYPRPAPGGSDIEASTVGYPNTAADHSSPGYPVPASYQMPAANVAGYAPATGGYSSPESGTASYSSGYQAPGSYPTAGTDGYRGDTAGRGGYPSSEYPSSELPGYRTETGSGAYPGALPGSYPPDSNSASYHDAGSYSLPAQTSGYDNGYPDQAASYQGYAASGSSSGAYLHPEAGYQAGYPGSAEPTFGGPLDGGHGDLSYPVYPAPVPAEHGAAYQAPAPQLPGYQDAAQQAGPYDPAAYPAPVHETGGYGVADPYAVDPYGQNGYGDNGY